MRLSNRSPTLSSATLRSITFDMPAIVSSSRNLLKSSLAVTGFLKCYAISNLSQELRPVTSYRRNFWCNSASCLINSSANWPRDTLHVAEFSSAWAKVDDGGTFPSIQARCCAINASICFKTSRVLLSTATFKSSTAASSDSIDKLMSPSAF